MNRKDFIGSVLGGLVAGTAIAKSAPSNVEQGVYLKTNKSLIPNSDIITIHPDGLDIEFYHDFTYDAIGREVGAKVVAVTFRFKRVDGVYVNRISEAFYSGTPLSFMVQSQRYPKDLSLRGQVTYFRTERSEVGDFVEFSLYTRLEGITYPKPNA